MAMYRRRPDQIEAVEILNPTSPDDAAHFSEMPEWLKQAIDQGFITWVFDTQRQETVVELHGPWGVLDAAPGDYLVRNPYGELNVMSRRGLESQYERLVSH
jgi:hypothetical protein